MSACLSNERAELLVYGYVKDQLGADNKLPTDVIQLCLKWYLEERDYWDLTKVHANISIDNDTAQLINRTSCKFGEYFTIVGSLIITKLTNTKEWKLKYLQMYGTRSIMIGIVPCDHDVISETEPLFNFGYGFDFYDGETKEFGNYSKDYPLPYEWKKSNKIVMQYVSISKDNNCHGELYIGFNDQELVKIFDYVKMDDNKRYRFAVSFYFADEEVQLLQ